MTRRGRTWLRLIALIVLCSAPAAAVQAAGLQISPISFSIASDKRADELWLRNNSEQPIHAQVRVFRWMQPDGEDVLTPDRALLASPPMVQIPPGKQQLVRLVRTGPLAQPAAEERSYRILVDELPVEREQASEIGLNFVFRYSIPVFIEGRAEKKKIPLDWQLRESEGQAMLILHNPGTRHLQLADLTFTPPRGEKIDVFVGLAGYVLPGQTRRLKLTLPPATFRAGGTFAGMANGAEITKDVGPITLQP
jgi:fimbrial chaperone protein